MADLAGPGGPAWEVKVKVPEVKVPGKVRVGVQTPSPPNQRIPESAINGMGKKAVVHLERHVNSSIE